MSYFKSWLAQRLQPPYLRLLAGAVVLMGLVLAVTCFVTSDQGTSAVGIPWGADFAGFYVAAQILDQGDTTKLYDRELHAQLYHRLLPKLPRDEIIPYVHPPFVAGTLRLLTWLPYDTAVAVWLFISLALYITGTLILLRACPTLDQPQRWLVVLLALSFEPFLFECWLGGQLSAVGYFSFALTYYFLKQGKPLQAGLALGICFYKPTLLLLMVPMLVIGQQWLMLAGMTVTGLFYLGLSLLLVGGDCTLGYVNVLLAFRQQSSGAEAFVIREWKYVDLNHFWQILLGKSIWKTMTLGISALLVIVPLAISWWRQRGLPADRLWAASLFLVPVINLYFGVYDTVVVVQAAIILTALVIQENQGRIIVSPWIYALVLLALVPWFTQPLAKAIGIQLMTLLMMAIGLVWISQPNKQSPAMSPTAG